VYLKSKGKNLKLFRASPPRGINLYGVGAPWQIINPSLNFMLALKNKKERNY
jgi:hypothetical protein